MGQPNSLHCLAVGEGGVRKGTVPLSQVSLHFQWLPPLLPHFHPQMNGSFWCWFPSDWDSVYSRILWVSPVDSRVRLGVSAAAATPHRFLQPEVLRLYFPRLEPWVAWSVSLPHCSSQFICMWMWDYLVHQLLPCCLSSPPWLPVSVPPTSLDECFFFKSLAVRLPHSSIS